MRGFVGPCISSTSWYFNICVPYLVLFFIIIGGISIDWISNKLYWRKKNIGVWINYTYKYTLLSTDPGFRPHGRVVDPTTRHDGMYGRVFQTERTMHSHYSHPLPILVGHKLTCLARSLYPIINLYGLYRVHTK